MISILRRRFWVVIATTVVICGVLAASAVSHALEATYLEESASPARASNLPLQPAAVVDRSKDGSMLAERNMFCSTCAAGVATPAGPEIGATDEGIPLTALPLELVATNISERPDWSFATIRNAASSQQGSFWIGDTLPGGGPIQRIGGRSVVFENRSTGRLEQVALLRARGRDQARTARRGDAGKPSNPFAEQIRKIDDTTFEVDRKLLTQLLARPESIKGARVRPVQSPGEGMGFRFYGVSKRSLPAALGLRSGDVVSAVNGMEFTTPDRLLEIITKVRELDRL